MIGQPVISRPAHGKPLSAWLKIDEADFNPITDALEAQEALMLYLQQGLRRCAAPIFGFSHIIEATNACSDAVNGAAEPRDALPPAAAR